MFTLVTILILCYLLIVIFVFFYQRSLLYHPSENNYTSEKANFNYEEILSKIESEKNKPSKANILKDKNINLYEKLYKNPKNIKIVLCKLILILN